MSDKIKKELIKTDNYLLQDTDNHLHDKLSVGAVISRFYS